MDIAGLVKGASRGEGLGNRFLSHIRSADSLLHLVRAFKDSQIAHVYGEPDPLRDIEIINTELLLADLEIAEKRFQKIQKLARVEGGKKLRQEAELLEKVLGLLGENKSLRNFKWTKEDRERLKPLSFISLKPVIYILNFKEEDFAPLSPSSGREREAGDSRWRGSQKARGALEQRDDEARKRDAAQERDGEARKRDGGARERAREIKSALGSREELISLSCALEADMAGWTEKEKAEFLSSMGLRETALQTVIKKAYSQLGLISFFTAGEKEAKAWTIPKGALAPEAGGAIHSDFEKGFIKAEVYHCEELFEAGSEKALRQKGLLRMAGKDYEVQDGDVMRFLFNV